MHLTFSLLGSAIRQSLHLYKKNFLSFFIYVSIVAIAIFVLFYPLTHFINYLTYLFWPVGNHHFYLKISIDLLAYAFKGIPLIISLTLIMYAISIGQVNRLPRKLCRTIFSLFGTMIIIALTMLFGIVLLVFCVQIIGSIFSINTDDRKELHYIIAVICTFIIIGRMLFVAPSIICDNLSPFSAIKKSWQLTKNATIKCAIISIAMLASLNRIIRLFYLNNSWLLQGVILVSALFIISLLIAAWVAIYKKLEESVTH